MVPVTDAIAAGLKMLRDREAILAIRKLCSGLRESGFRPIATAEKLLFNIGRIPARQSRFSGFAGTRRQILPPGRKGGRRRRSVVYRRGF
jgi:hypothetical protein